MGRENIGSEIKRERVINAGANWVRKLELKCSADYGLEFTN